MDDSDNLVGKKSSDTNTDYHDNPISGDDKESQEDLGTPKNNSSENEGSPQGNSSGRNENKKSKKDKGPDDIVILKMNILELFVDQIGDAYAAVKIKDYIEAIPINSGRFRDWIVKTCYDYKKQLQSNDFENECAIRILGNEEAAKYQTIIRLQAEEQRNERRLEIRVAGNVDPNASKEDGNMVYYDLCNKSGQIIRITRNGWEIIKHGCQLEEEQSLQIIVFKHYSNQLPQVMPSREYQDDISERFLDLINIPADDVENRLLAEVYYISLYFPSVIPKPILITYGEQGSAKSTFQEFIKDLVDPCGALTLSFPTSITELVQQLSHNWVTFYDNVSSLSPWISDALCRGVTGTGFSKRRLYTDDEDVPYSFRRCLGLNGINIAATKPDLLERALTLHLKRFQEDKRCTTTYLRKQFEIIRPQLLGFIFNVIVKVLNRLDVQLTNFPRMADWAQLGEIISRCLGYPEDAFLKAYRNNLAKQNQHALEASQVAQAMIRLMQKRMSEGFGLSVCLEGIHYFKGSMTELRGELNQIAEIELDINIKDRNRWPQSSQALGNKLGEAATNLREVGIIIERPENKSNHSKDVILIKQDVGDWEQETRPLGSFSASSPSKNDQIHAQFAQKPGNGKLGNIPMSVAGEKKKDEGSGSAIPPGVPASSPSSPVSRFEENHAQIASDTDGKPGGEVEGYASSCSPLIQTSNTQSEIVKVNTITDFFYNDPTMPYVALPDHKLDQSPCCPIIAIKDGYYYCTLHPEIKNTHLESIEHHIKYKDPATHKSQLLKLSKLTHN